LDIGRCWSIPLYPKHYSHSLFLVCIKLRRSKFVRQYDECVIVEGSLGFLILPCTIRTDMIQSYSRHTSQITVFIVGIWAFIAQIVSPRREKDKRNFTNHAGTFEQFFERFQPREPDQNSMVLNCDSIGRASLALYVIGNYK